MPTDPASSAPDRFLPNPPPPRRDDRDDRRDDRWCDDRRSDRSRDDRRGNGDQWRDDRDRGRSSCSYNDHRQEPPIHVVRAAQAAAARYRESAAAVERLTHEQYQLHGCYKENMHEEQCEQLIYLCLYISSKKSYDICGGFDDFVGPRVFG